MSDKRTEPGQYVAQGDHDPSDHAKDVEREAQVHGCGHVLNSQPGLDTQTGPIGPTPGIK